MSHNITYRRDLLQATEAFLEGTPASLTQAQRIIQRCHTAVNSEEKGNTLDEIIWSFFVKALTDSVYFESADFLQETREILLGHSSQDIARTVFCRDYRSSFTAGEAAWYRQLLSLLDFLTALPFAQIHEAATPVWRDRESWKSRRDSLPELRQAEEIEEEYLRRKVLIEELFRSNPSPEDLGDETIYHLVLREVSHFLTRINPGKPAAYFGYPILDVPFTAYLDPTHSTPTGNGDAFDVTEKLLWAQRSLEALAGKEPLFLSWRLSKASTFGADVLVVSWH